MYINEEYKKENASHSYSCIGVSAMAQQNDIESKGRKRKLEELEVDGVESLDEPLSTACVHGVISTLSPIKKSNYFDGSVSDGKSNIRLVGFNPSQQIRMKNLMENKHAVKIDDCEVRHACRGQSMDILLKGSRKISYVTQKI